MDTVSFSIVICTRNRSIDLSNCLESIYRQSYPIYEIIVVDSSSNDDSEKAVEFFQIKSTISLRYIHTTPGLTRQRNIGVKNSTGDVIAFFDDDVILDPDYLKVMTSCFSNKNIYGATGFVIGNQHHSELQESFYRFFMLTYNHKKGVMKRSGFATFVDSQLADTVQPTDILSGCNMLFRRCVFDDNTFDEFFDGYSMMEDVEFSHRVSKAHNLVFMKEAKLLHVLSKIERIDLKKYFEMTVVNHYYVFYKNVISSLVDWIFFIWSTIGIFIKCIFWCSKNRNFAALEGFYRGHLRIFKMTIL